jgi:hypothetical protein
MPSRRVLPPTSVYGESATGWPRALPLPGFRGAGLTGFSHPVPRITASPCAVVCPPARHFVGFASSLSVRVSFRCSPGSVTRSSFLPNSPVVPCSHGHFPPQGRFGGYPCSFGTTSCYDSPPTSFFTSLSFVPRYRSHPLAPRTRQGLAGSWGALWVRLPSSSTPSPSSRLALKDDLEPGSCGWSAALRRCLSPSLGRRSRRLRSASMLPPDLGRPGARELSHFRSSFTRPSRSLSTLRSLPPQQLSARARLFRLVAFAGFRVPSRFQSISLH